MGLIFIPLSVLVLLLLVIFFLSNLKFDHWKKQNVPHLKPSLILGNYGEFILLKKYIGYVVQEICRAFPDEPVVGAYYGTEPALIVQDPELIRLITTKDFNYFNGREISKYTSKEINTQNLFFTYGDKWKFMRKNMSPLFTSTKLKSMFLHSIEKCVFQLEKMLEDETEVSDVVEVRSLAARYTMGCICSSFYGIDTKTMRKGSEKNPFRMMGNIIFEHSITRGLTIVTRAIWPAVFYGLGLRLFSKTITDFFHNFLTGILQARGYKPSARNDFVDMILDLKKNIFVICESFSATINQKVNLKIDDDFLVAQCVAFFAAGYETSSNTLSLTLYELAKREESQRRAIEEVDAYLQRHEGKVKYECVFELPYLEACLSEAMRLYPVLAINTREVMEDYTLPSGLRLVKGLRVHLPVYHLHHHPEHFPEPEQFRPERFLGEEKKNIKPYTYMPFGEGPRTCIGMRFAKMQILAGLVTVFRKYRVELAEGTPTSVEFEPKHFLLQLKTKLQLKLIQREYVEKNG